MHGSLLQSRGGRPYGKLSYVDRRWVMSDIEPHVSIRLKSLFPSIKKAQTGTFEFSDTENICADIHWFAQRYPLEMSGADKRRLTERKGLFEQQRDDIERIMMPDWRPPAKFGFRSPYELWHLQAQAVEILHQKKRLLLGDSLGMGKTFTALGSIVGSEYLPAAILAKTHLPTQWVEEFIRPATYLSSHIIGGRSVYQLPPANVYIFKYSNIAGWADIAATGMFKAFIADEAHELRTGVSTDKGQAAKVFAENSQICLGMSGTPIFNYGDEIFNILDIFAPGALGKRDEFYREWCTSNGNNKWIVDDPDALGTYLREIQVFLRREREGRPVNTQVVNVDYDHAVEEQDRALAKILAIKTLQGTFVESGQAARDLDALMRHATGVAKAKGVAAFVRILVSQGIPVLLFSWHRDVYTILLKELAEFNPRLYTGTETAKQKDKAKKAFMDGETNLLILSLRSGDGIDGLQLRCSTIVFGEYDWSPGVHQQAIGRVDRPKQPKDVIDVFYCHVDEGSDPTIVSMHGLKASQAHGIVNPLAGVRQIYRDEARVKLLAQNYLDRQGVSL